MTGSQSVYLISQSNSCCSAKHGSNATELHFKFWRIISALQTYPKNVRLNLEECVENYAKNIKNISNWWNVIRKNNKKTKQGARGVNILFRVNII